MATIEGFFTGLKELVAAIEGLTLGGGTTVVEAPNVVINNYCNCCGVGGVAGAGGAGVTIEQPAGIEGGTPPTGTTAASDITDRKCKVANMLTSDLIQYTAGMENAGFFDWAMDYSTLGSMLTSLSTGLGLLLIESSMQIGGWLASMATWLFSATPGGPSIAQTLEDNREAIVCALYNATDVETARTEAITASTLTGDEADYLALLINNNALNLLFFASGGSESKIEAYSGGVDCGGCNPSQAYLQQMRGDTSLHNQYGSTQFGQWVTVNSTDEGGYHLVTFTPVGGSMTVEYQNLSGWTQGPWGENHFQVRRNNFDDVVYLGTSFSGFASASSGACIPDVDPNFGQWTILSTTQFTVDIRITECG